MTAPTKDEFYAIAFDDVDANLSHEECEEWAEFMTAPTETPSLTTEQARVLASRWSDAMDGSEHERTAKIAAWLTIDEDREQLFAWVRARMATACEGTAVIGETNLRAVMLMYVAQDLGLSLAAGEALCESSGWPS